MNSTPYNDYPWGPFRAALGTTFGKIAILAATFLIAFGIGSAFAIAHIAGLLVGIIQLPWIVFFSILFGLGILILPTFLIFAFFFTRYDFPLWTLIFPLIGLAYLSFDSTDYVLNRSAGAQLQKKIDATVEKALQETRKEKNSIEQDAAANP